MNPSGLLSIYIWSNQSEPSPSKDRNDVETLEVVMDWADDAQVFQSKLLKLQLVEDDRGDQFNTLHYVGELPKKYHKGGDILLIAPIVRIHDRRESFDLIITVPPVVDREEPAEINTAAPHPTTQALDEVQHPEADASEAHSRD